MAPLSSPPPPRPGTCVFECSALPFSVSMVILFPYNSAPSRSHEAALRQTNPPTKLTALMQLYVPEQEYRVPTSGARAVNHPSTGSVLVHRCAFTILPSRQWSSGVPIASLASLYQLVNHNNSLQYQWPGWPPLAVTEVSNAQGGKPITTRRRYTYSGHRPVDATARRGMLGCSCPRRCSCYRSPLRG